MLNDPSKRELYDRYGSSFESMGAGAGAAGGGPRGGRYNWSNAGGGEEVDFSQLFGQRGGGADPSGMFGDIFTQFRRAGAEEAAARDRNPRAEPTSRPKSIFPSTRQWPAAKRRSRCSAPMATWKPSA